MNELTLSTLLSIFKKCVIYMILVGFLFAVGAYCFCKFIATPTYQSTTSVIATNGGLNPETEINSNIAGTESVSSEVKIQTGDYSASRYLLDTYVSLFKTRKFHVMLQEECGLDYTPDQLRGMVSVARRSEYELFIDFTVTSTNKEHAVIIADAIYEIGDEYISSVLPAAYVMAIEDSNGRSYKNYPTTFVTTVISAFLGGVLVFVIAFIINLMDKTIKGEKDFSANYDIPILGNIPNFKAAAREEKK